MSAAEVIAQEVWQAYVAELGRSMPEGLADKLAAGVVPALEAARYVVVELPKPGELSDHHDDDDVVFYYGQEGEVLRGDPGDVWVDDILFSVDSAREYAAAILAAADSAEANA